MTCSKTTGLLSSAHAHASYRFWNSVLALLLTLTFVFPYLTWAFEPGTYASGSSLSPLRHAGKPIVIPAKLGMITETFQGHSKTLVCIQDLHCNAEVQHNIARMIEYLASHHGVTLVGEEGAARTVDVSVLRDVPEAGIRKDVGAYFVEQGKLTGAEYAAVTVPQPIRLEGIESPELYAAGLQAVRSFLNAESQGLLFDLRELLSELKVKVYSEPLREYDEKCQAAREGKWDLIRHALYLKRQAEKQGLEVSRWPELARFFAQPQAGVSREFDTEALYRQMDELDAAIRAGLYTTDAQRELDEQLRRVDILEKLLNISVTPEELETYRAHREDYAPQKFIKFLVRQGAAVEAADAEPAALAKYLRQAEAFYELADTRSVRFVDNLVRKMEQAGTDVAVMVNGGFHLPGVTAELRRRNLSYAAVRPCLTQPDVVNPYFSLLQARKLPIEKLLEQKQSLLAVPSAPEADPGFGVRSELFVKALAQARRMEQAFQAYSGKHHLVGLQMQERGTGYARLAANLPGDAGVVYLVVAGRQAMAELKDRLQTFGQGVLERFAHEGIFLSRTAEPAERAAQQLARPSPGERWRRAAWALPALGARLRETVGQWRALLREQRWSLPR